MQQEPEDLFDVGDTQFAGNIGFGLMGFGEQWGFRAGMRYVAGFDQDPIPGDLDQPSISSMRTTCSETSHTGAATLAWRFAGRSQ